MSFISNRYLTVKKIYAIFWLLSLFYTAVSYANVQQRKIDFSIRIENFQMVNVEKAYSVVEVTGAYKGNGLLVQIEDANGNLQTRILTNSHIVGDKDQVQIYIEEESFDAEVEYNDALADIAMLKPKPVLESTLKILNYLAQANGVFKKSGFYPAGEKLIGYSVLNFVDSKVNRSDRMIAPFKAVLIEDRYISGLYSKIYEMPIYARPGVSGGGFYEKYRLKGLITKVFLDASPGSFAIPMTEIQKNISNFYFSTNNKRKKYSAEWVRKNDELTLHIIHEKDEIIASMTSSRVALSGGDTGGGGGDTGGGGGDTGGGGGNASVKYWDFVIPMYISAAQKLSTSNPFWHSPNYILINGKKVSSFKVFASDDSFKIHVASVAEFIYLKEKNIKFEVLDQEAQDQLISDQRSLNAERFNFARFYLKQKNVFVQSTKYIHDTVTEDGSQALYIDLIQPMRINNDVFWDEQRFMADLRNPERSSTYPFAAKINLDSNTILDVLFKSSTSTPKSEYVQIQMDKNLDSIQITFQNQTLSLKPENKSAVTSIYLSENHQSNARAALVFDEHDLSKIERLYVEFNNNLFEFINCFPGKSCVR